MTVYFSISMQDSGTLGAWLLLSQVGQSEPPETGPYLIKRGDELKLVDPDHDGHGHDG